MVQSPRLRSLPTLFDGHGVELTRETENTLWRVQNNYIIFMKLDNNQERKTNENGVSNADAVDVRADSHRKSVRES